MEGTPPDNGRALRPRRRGDELATEAERARTPRTSLLVLAGGRP
jgi:hypothetical protein